MTDIYTINLLDILPASIREDPQVQAMAAAITPELQAVSANIAQCILIPRVIKLQDPDYPLEFPDEVLDVLAWGIHVDFYEPDLAIEQKRELIRNSGAWHRRKGTKWAVEQVVSIVFPTAVVTEWFEYGGEPFHFRLETDQTLAGDVDLDRLVRMINATKNTRSHLENVTIKRTIANEQFYGAAISCWNTTTITPGVS